MSATAFLQLFEARDVIIMGTVYQGAVRAERVDQKAFYDANGEIAMHGHFQGLSQGQRWRFPESGKAIIWWEPPDEETRARVDIYLEKRGFTGLRHIVAPEELADTDTEKWDRIYDVAHGFLNPTKRNLRGF